MSISTHDDATTASAQAEPTESREEALARLHGSTMFAALGGLGGVRRLVDAFYDTMDADADLEPLRAIHADDLGPMRVLLTEFLSGWLGGPALYIERTGSPCLHHAHAPFVIDAAAAEQWRLCMDRAMDAAGVHEAYREMLAPAFAGMTEMLRNDG